MTTNAGVNRVYLVGVVGGEPEWDIILGERVLYFQLLTVETFKKGTETQLHTERHHVILSAEYANTAGKLRAGHDVYVQGRMRTRIVYEAGVRLYKTEIMALNINWLTNEQ